MQQINKVIREYLKHNRQLILSDWEELTRCESWTGEADHVTAVAILLKDKLESIGARCTLHDLGPHVGKCLEGSWNGDSQEQPILFLGHLDTVFPIGSWGEPLYTSYNGLVHGPGCCDMKGGLVIVLWVVKALMECGFSGCPIRLLFVSDEENGHKNSCSAEWLRKHAEGCRAALNMEPGRTPNGVTISRKGCMSAEITVKGVSGHAGNDFETSKNPIIPISRIALALSELTDITKGTTVSCDVIRGGDVYNRIPEEASLQVDCRYISIDEQQRLMNEFKNICDSVCESGFQTEYVISFGQNPLVKSAKTLQLYESINALSISCGLGSIDKCEVGGSSDASIISDIVPTLCSCGVVGSAMHSREEWADEQSLFDRILLWTLWIMTNSSKNAVFQEVK